MRAPTQTCLMTDVFVVGGQTTRDLALVASGDHSYRNAGIRAPVLYRLSRAIAWGENEALAFLVAH